MTTPTIEARVQDVLACARECSHKMANAANWHRLETLVRSLAASATQVPQGWKLVPVEPTPDMLAAAATAVLPDPDAADFELAREAARIVLAHPACQPTATLEEIASALGTMPRFYRSMIAAGGEK